MAPSSIILETLTLAWSHFCRAEHPAGVERGAPTARRGGRRVHGGCGQRGRLGGGGGRVRGWRRVGGGAGRVGRPPDGSECRRRQHGLSRDRCLTVKKRNETTEKKTRSTRLRTRLSLAGRRSPGGRVVFFSVGCERVPGGVFAGCGQLPSDCLYSGYIMYRVSGALGCLLYRFPALVRRIV